jgi:hypothetical protein
MYVCIYGCTCNSSTQRLRREDQLSPDVQGQLGTTARTSKKTKQKQRKLGRKERKCYECFLPGAEKILSPGNSRVRDGKSCRARKKELDRSGC